MAVKKATVSSTMAKVEATKVAPVEEKVVEKKAPVKKAAAKPAAKATEAKAAAPAKEAPAKKAPAKKAPVKKATTETNVVVEYNQGQISTADLVAKAVELSGKKAVKSLNVYYQPETGMVYFTADGEEGSFAL